MRASAPRCEDEKSGGSNGATGRPRNRSSPSTSRSSSQSAPASTASTTSARRAPRPTLMRARLLFVLPTELLVRLPEQLVEVLRAALLARQRLVELVARLAEALADAIRGRGPVALAQHGLAGLVALTGLAPAHDLGGAHVDLQPALAARTVDVDFLLIHLLALQPQQALPVGVV